MLERSRDGSGLFLYVMNEDEYDAESDRRDLMIANYRPARFELNVLTPTELDVEVGGSARIQFEAMRNSVVVLDGVRLEVVACCEDIVSVAPCGLIEGLGVGEATIKVIFNDIVREISVRVVDNVGVFQDSVSIAGEPFIRVGGSRTFSATFFDGAGNEISDVAKWSVDGSPAFATLADLGANGVRLNIQNSIVLVGQRIVLRVTGASGLVSTSIEIELASIN